MRAVKRLGDLLDVRDWLVSEEYGVSLGKRQIEKKRVPEDDRDPHASKVNQDIEWSRPGL